MNLLLNLVLGVIAFLIVRTVLALVGLDGAVGWLLAVLAGVVVFLQDYASRFNR